MRKLQHIKDTRAGSHVVMEMQIRAMPGWHVESSQARTSMEKPHCTAFTFSQAAVLLHQIKNAITTLWNGSRVIIYYSTTWNMVFTVWVTVLGMPSTRKQRVLFLFFFTFSRYLEPCSTPPPSLIACWRIGKQKLVLQTEMSPETENTL